MKVKLIQIGNKDLYTIQINFGVQYFNLKYQGNKKEAQWMARMVRKCFANYKQSIITNYEHEHNIR